MPHFPDRRVVSLTADRRCALSLALCAGAYLASPFGPEARGSIRRRRRPGFHQPPGLSADARRVLVPFAARIRLGRESRHAPRRASRPASGRPSYVPVLGVAPREALAHGHLDDDRVVLAESVGPPVAGLRLTAADVAARGAE